MREKYKIKAYLDLDYSELESVSTKIDLLNKKIKEASSLGKELTSLLKSLNINSEIYFSVAERADITS